ncbi:MAG: PAS domain S-box protein [Promethearchaeota archaeon]
MFSESVERYYNLLEVSPISLWEEDFSEIKKFIDQLKNIGIKNFEIYFENHPEDIKKCIKMVKIININKRTLDIYKAKSKDDFKQGLQDIFTEKSYKTFRDLLVAITEGKIIYENESIDKTYEGDQIHIFMKWVVLPGYEETLSRTLNSIIDITDLKRTEIALRESEAKFRLISENMLLGVLIHKEGNIKYANEAVAKIYGYSIGEIMKWKREDFARTTHPNDLSFLEDYGRNKLVGGSDVMSQYSNRIITKSGEIKWIDIFSKSIIFQGGFANFITMIDITKYKHVELALRESEEKYQLITNNINELIVLMNNKYEIEYINEHVYQKILGYSNEDILGKNYLNYVHANDLSRMYKFLKQIFEKSQEEQEIRFKHKHGFYIWFHINGRAFKDKVGNLKCTLILRNINKEKRIESEMKRRLIKYNLDEGNIYLTTESVSKVSIEAFQDLLQVGYKGFIFSRTSTEDFQKTIENEFKLFWFAEEGGKNSLAPNLREIENEIKKIPSKSVIFINRLDYLVFKNDFKKILSFIQHLREYAYFNKYIIILSIDPSIFKESEMNLIKKETKKFTPRQITKLPFKLLQVLRFIYVQNNLGVKPSFNNIKIKFNISYPTVRKRINQLLSYEYVKRIDSGKKKILQLTDKGNRLFSI